MNDDPARKFYGPTPERFRELDGLDPEPVMSPWSGEQIGVRPTQQDLAGRDVGNPPLKRGG